MKKLLKWIGIAFVGLFVLVLVFGGKGTGTKMKNSFEAGFEAGSKSGKTTTNSYQELSRKDNGTVENVSVLVASGETKGATIAKELLKTCKKQCNISLYDDRKAYDLQSEYDQLMKTGATKQSDLDAWKKQNYVYVADHLIGYQEFSSNTYAAYPFRDSQYKELKGQ